MKTFALMLALIVAPAVVAQQTSALNEKRVSLNEAAVALDASGASVLEATLATNALNGAPDNPITNTRIVIRNSSTTPYVFISGVVTFYDTSGVRCGDGVFKADALAPNEAFETDTPGIRIRCSPATWRVVATNLIPRVVTPPAPMAMRLIITVDGEQHPIQLDKPLTLNVGDKKRTIVVREAP